MECSCAESNDYFFLKIIQDLNFVKCCKTQAFKYSVVTGNTRHTAIYNFVNIMCLISSVWFCNVYCHNIIFSNNSLFVVQCVIFSRYHFHHPHPLNIFCYIFLQTKSFSLYPSYIFLLPYSWSHIDEYCFIWQLDSVFNQAILHDSRQHRPSSSSKLPWFRNHIF